MQRFWSTPKYLDFQKSPWMPFFLKKDVDICQEGLPLGLKKCGKWAKLWGFSFVRFPRLFWRARPCYGLSEFGVSGMPGRSRPLPEHHWRTRCHGPASSSTGLTSEQLCLPAGSGKRRSRRPWTHSLGECFRTSPARRAPPVAAPEWPREHWHHGLAHGTPPPGQVGHSTSGGVGFAGAP